MNQMLLLIQGLPLLSLFAVLQIALASPEFKPDFSLLQPRSNREHQQLGDHPPFFRQYRRGSKQLIFMGAQHTPRLNSSTHAMIRRLIHEFHPDCVVIEGLETKEGTSPPGPLRDARHLIGQSQCPEPLYAATLAADRGIPFLGGEPSSQVTLEALRAEGNPQDALGFLVLRQLGQLRREETTAALDTSVQRAIRELKRRFHLNAAMDVADFKAWFQKKTGRRFEPRNVVGGMTAPVAESNPDFIRRQAIRVMLARERHLIGLWASLLAKYDRVLVIYGAGHFVYERAILEDLFGHPVRDTFEAPSPAPR